MKLLTRLTPVTLACLLTVSGATFAQQDAPATDAHDAALEVYLAGFNAMKTDGIAALADYIHPDELAKFKNTMAELFEVIAQDSGAQNSPFLDSFRDADGAVDFATINPVEFFRGFGAMISSLSPQFNQMFANMETEVIGSVPEGDSLLHFVTRNRMSFMGTNIEGMEVVTMIPSGDSWKMALSADIEELASSLSTMLQGR